MQVSSSSILTKTSRVITAGVRNTSCNRGWLQLFTHLICGTFTVTCFILILITTLKPARQSRSTNELRCQFAGCHVICNEAPFYEEHEDDIVLAVMDASIICQKVFLTLRKPTFTNESLPQSWLRELQPVVTELRIIGGNLQHIPSNVFSTAFARNVEILSLEKITITTWTPYALLGLSSLSIILMKDCVIIDLQENALSAVSQTLQTLSVVQGSFWDPTKLTGLTQPTRNLRLESLPLLTTVDFSHNEFGAILGNSSFNRLPFCRSLYLSSSKISYIGPGAFDHLINLQYLNLNDNLLISVEPGLFDVITSPRPPGMPILRLNLVDNLWRCHCSDRDLRRLVKMGFLIVNPLCYFPIRYRGQTFHEFNNNCRKKEPQQIVVVDMTLSKNANIGDVEDTKVHSLTCVSKSFPNYTPTVISPFHDYPCSINVINGSMNPNPSMVLDFNNTEKIYWIKPLLVVRKDNFTMIELGFSGIEGYGLIWYRSACINDVYCVNVMPDTIRLYNVDLSNEYTFCPVTLLSGTVQSTQCIAYASTTTTVVKSRSNTRVIMYPLIAVGCLFFGALSLYMLILKYPYLLKGSKRLLFVKHKTVDALVLPPKVPLRSVLSDRSLDNSTEMFDMSEPFPYDFVRSGSVRSNHSYAPSYISALQPTEEQLTDWRFKHANERFDGHYATISTISSDMPVSLSSGGDHLYFSLEDGSPTISIIDPFNQNPGNKTLNLS